MMGQHSPAACCCTFCEDCCNGFAPTEFDVDVTVVDGDCDTCDTFVSGIYTLAANGPCIWRYIHSPISGQYCVTPYPANNDRIVEVAVTLSIKCINDTQYRIVMTLDVARRYDTGEEVVYGFAVPTRNYTGLDVYRYESTVNFSDFRCDQAANYELTLVSKTATRRFEFFNVVMWQVAVFGTAPPNATSWMGWDVAYYCDPPATVTITAVP